MYLFLVFDLVVDHVNIFLDLGCEQEVSAIG